LAFYSKYVKSFKLSPTLTTFTRFIDIKLYNLRHSKHILKGYIIPTLFISGRFFHFRCHIFPALRDDKEKVKLQFTIVSFYVVHHDLWRVPYNWIRIIKLKIWGIYFNTSEKFNILIFKKKSLNFKCFSYINYKCHNNV